MRIVVWISRILIPAVHQLFPVMEEYMRITIGAVTVIAGAALFLAGCGQSEKGSSNASGLGLLALMSLSASDALAEMSQSSLETVNDGMADINTSGETSLSYRVQFPGAWQNNSGFQERLLMAEGRIMEPFSISAATVSCPGGGSIDVTDAADTWNSGNGSFFVARSFNRCTGPFGLFNVNGDALLFWSGMNAGATGAAKLQAGSKLEQAPVGKRFTRIATGGYIMVEGNGATLSNGGLTGAIAHTVNWTAVSGTSRSFEIRTDLTRRGYNSLGKLLFEHHVTTPAYLSITADTASGTRTVSGTVQVEHVRSGVFVRTTFTNLVMPMDTCTPSTGTATIVISGYWDGSGTITYNGDGTADYTYSYTNERGRTVSGDGTFAVSGCQ